MITNRPYPYQPLSPEEMQALIRRAHAERAQAMKSFLLWPFRHNPTARKRADPVPAAVACT